MTDQPGTLSVEESAARLGVSGQTIRRMIKKGELAADLVVGRKGKEWRVARSGLLAEEVGGVVGNLILPSPELADLARLLRELLQRDEEKNQRIIELERALAAAQATQKLIETPKRKWWQVWG